MVRNVLVEVMYGLPGSQLFTKAAISSDLTDAELKESFTAECLRNHPDLFRDSFEVLLMIREPRSERHRFEGGNEYIFLKEPVRDDADDEGEDLEEA